MSSENIYVKKGELGVKTGLVKDENDWVYERKIKNEGEYD